MEMNNREIEALTLVRRLTPELAHIRINELRAIAEERFNALQKPNVCALNSASVFMLSSLLTDSERHEIFTLRLGLTLIGIDSECASTTLKRQA